MTLHSTAGAAATLNSLTLTSLERKRAAGGEGKRQGVRQGRGGVFG
jgi:hypothetical protein